MISDNAIGAIPDNATGAISAVDAVSPPVDADPPAGQPFLRLYLTSKLPILLSVQQLMEILTIPNGQIVPMFQMPPWVMGVHNWRGEVLWMVDLNHFLGLTPWYQQTDHASKHTAIVIRSSRQTNWVTEEAILGLVVNRVEDVVVCDPNTIHPPSDALPSVPGIKPFLQGYWQQSPDQRYFILDSAALLQAMPTADSSILF